MKKILDFIALIREFIFMLFVKARAGLNLQLFAGEAVDYNTNVTTDVGLSAEMRTYYEKQLLRRVVPYLVHNQFGQKKPIPKNGGKTVNFRRFLSLGKALTPLTEGVTPKGQKVRVSKVEATVQQYGAYIAESDILQMTAIDPIIEEDTKLIAEQGGLTLDTITRDVMQSTTSVFYAPKKAISDGVETRTAVTSRKDIDASCIIDAKLITQVEAALKNQGAKPFEDGYYVWIIHPFVSCDFMNDKRWIDVNKYNDAKNIYQGELGRFSKFRFVESTEAKVYKGADLAEDSETLKVDNALGYTGAISSIAFDGGTVKEDALEGRYILINGVKAEVASNTTSAITLVEATDFGTVADNAVIYPGEAGKQNTAVFGCLALGTDAYGITNIEGGGLEMIVKPLGSGGTADPLNQRATVGWKATHVAELLNSQHIIRVECSSEMGEDITEEN